MDLGARRGPGNGSNKEASLLDQAEAAILRAKDWEKDGRWSAALEDYGAGAELLLAAANEERDDARKQAIRKEVAHYVAKAEEMKARGGGSVQSKGGMTSDGITTFFFGKRRSNSESRPSPRTQPPQLRSSGSGGGGGGASSTARAPAPGNARTAVTRGPGYKPAAAAAPRTAGARAAGGGGGASGSGVGGGAASGDAAAGKGQDKQMQELEAHILEEMLDTSPGVTWDAIAGLDDAKQTLQEAVILPNLRPDLFTGLRAPSKGVLLYGPPGTGKTMLAKAVATESRFAFFGVSAASLTSKYLGEGEKLVRALFRVARARQPAVIFLDEADALLSKRGSTEHEASRRLKTEFMVQLDGIASGGGGGSGGDAAAGGEERLLVLAATNLPQELDEAVLRRFGRRIYVPLPDPPARNALIARLLKGQRHSLGRGEMEHVVAATEGYSCSDLTQVCKEAAMQPLRHLGPERLRTARASEVPPISADDFTVAITKIRPTVSNETLRTYDEWESRSR